ncbi:uncharacterized protein N7473_011044 [Penicillium subrubescens]|uniref:uncharacterized protein n=1 Tax=Penicillium subrubescens TaxID=1316194 RepID=UPI002545B7CD|nr:uncharacterized protein N7473_011044 [Penicillium subrubescens]KAJ5882782.1 hypothetical protein N7473_011044 [Penicillium subrubescens]
MEDSNLTTMTEVCCASEFVANVLPLYCGPYVRLQVASSDREYTVSKSLLCTMSPYFSALLEGPILETQHSVFTLQKVEGVVSDQSLEALIQWLYLRAVVFAVDDPTEQISAAIELARLADMCRISGLAAPMAEYIQKVVLSNPSPESDPYWRHADTNTHYITSQHIASACTLPPKHPVRHVLAKASVEGYLRQQDYKFFEETQLYPSFGADLLAEVSMALGGLISNSNVAFEDPISGVRVELNTRKSIQWGTADNGMTS